VRPSGAESSPYAPVQLTVEPLSPSTGQYLAHVLKVEDMLVATVFAAETGGLKCHWPVEEEGTTRWVLMRG
jgi:hypothetical protein